MFELNGKVCLITGGSRGLGESMAITFAKSGAEAVVITYNSDENKAIEVCKNIEIHGSKSMAIHLEVSNTDSIKKMVSSVEKEFSKIDVLVNNAGINRQAKMEDVTEKDWDDIMSVNLKGPFFCSREVFPIMKKNGGGRIINIGSVSGLYGGPTTPHYGASKAGLHSVTQNLARYGAEHNIFVNSISPGIIETDLTREELKSGGGGKVVALTLLKRPGVEMDVSSIALMLASNEQNYLTGQIISPNGGSYFTV